MPTNEIGREGEVSHNSQSYRRLMNDIHMHSNYVNLNTVPRMSYSATPFLPISSGAPPIFSSGPLDERTGYLLTRTAGLNISNFWIPTHGPIPIQIKFHEVLQKIENTITNSYHSKRIDKMKPYTILKDNKITFHNAYNNKSDYSFTIEAPITIEQLKTVIDQYNLSYAVMSSHERLTHFHIREKQTKDFIIVEVPTNVLNRMLVHNYNDIAQSKTMLGSTINHFKAALLAKQYVAASNYLFKIFHQEAKQLASVKFTTKLKELLDGSIDTINVAESESIKNYLYNFMTSQSTSIKPISAHYTLLNARNKDNTTYALNKKLISKYYDRFNYVKASPRCTTVIKHYKETVEASPVQLKVDINFLLPKLKDELKSLSNVCSYSFSTSVLSASEARDTWVMFIHIKNQLMLAGLSEVEAVNYIRKEALEDKLEAGTCEITKQLVLAPFLIDCKLLSNKVVKANIYYLYEENRMVKRYYWADDKFEELLLSDTKYYTQTARNHAGSALTYLSPRGSSSENTQVFNAGKVFQPIPYLGVELEVERQKDCKETVTENVINTLGRDFVIIKQDGSLGGHCPFEIVSIPATLKLHKERWYDFMNDTALKAQLRSYTSGQCGMHVHVNRASFTGLHLAKFMRFFNAIENRRFIGAIAQRENSSYAQFTDYDSKHKSSISQAADRVYGGMHSHYDAINTSNANTVEVRIFRGNLAKGHFYKNLEFVDSVWLYTKNCSMKELNYKDFITWLLKDNIKTYSNLIQWLIASGYNISNRNSDIKGYVKTQNDKVKLIINRKFNTSADNDVLRKASRTTVISKGDLLKNG